MELEVVWTKRAKSNYLKILSYIENKFGHKSGEQYFERVTDLIPVPATNNKVWHTKSPAVIPSQEGIYKQAPITKR